MYNSPFLFQAVDIAKQIAGSLRLDILVSHLTAVHAYTAVVEICLAAAAKKDPQVLYRFSCSFTRQSDRLHRRRRDMPGRRSTDRSTGLILLSLSHLTAVNAYTAVMEICLATEAKKASQFTGVLTLFSSLSSFFFSL